MSDSLSEPRSLATAIVSRVLICPFCADEFPDAAPRRCPTCGHNCQIGAELRVRLAWARVFTWLGLLLFPPALWTPLLVLENLGGRTKVSFVTGIETLLVDRDYLLAGVIVVFSGLVPLVKSAAMLVLTSSRFLTEKHSRVVYGIVEFTSRFSMVDVFVSGFSIMLFKGSPSFRLEAQPGILVFTCMVLCNLFAAMLYDSRVLGFKEPSQ